MKPAAWRLVLMGVLFLGWVGYLAYLALMTSNHVVLSRPQLLVSDLHVLATRQTDDAFVVNEVLWPADKDGEWRGKTIVLSNPKECQVWSKAEHWHYALPPEGGEVLLPLYAVQPAVDDRAAARVTPIPPSPGHMAPGPSYIYPADAEVLSQYRTIPKP